MPEKEQTMFQKEYGVDSTVVVDLPASFNRSWCNRYSISFISSY